MISSLRQNSLEVLVSPRVRTIPKSYRVTVFTYLFIILVSVAVALTYTYLSSSTTCQARPLGPELENEQFDCSGFKIRREFAAQLDISNATLGITSVKFFQDIELQFEVVAPEFLSSDFSELQLAPELMSELSRMLLRLLGLSPALGFSLDPVPNHHSFTDVIVAEGGAIPGLDVRIVPLGSMPNFDVALFGLNQFAASTPLTDPSINVTVDEYSLLMFYETLGRLDCLVQFDFLALSGESRLKAACFARQTVGTSAVIKYSYVSAQTLDAFQATEAFLVYVQSMHGPLYNDDDGGFELLEQMFATNFFFCCFPDNLDEVEYFGIFSGLMFFLEGVFTFIFVAVVFRGRISSKEKAFDDNKRHSFAYSFREGVAEEVSLKAAMLEDEELEKRSVQSVGRRDIIRVLFNPRCRYIPYASVVSLLSLAVLMGVSAVLAIWYQALRTVKVCEPTPVNDLSATTPNCESLGVTSVFYAPITSGPITLPLQITAQVQVDEGEVTELDPNEFFNQALVDAFGGCTGLELTACTSGAYTAIEAAVPGAIITNSTETPPEYTEFMMNINRVVNNGLEDTIFNFDIEARVDFQTGGVAAANDTVASRKFEIRWSVQRVEPPADPLSPPKTLLEYSAKFGTNFIGQERIFDPFNNGGDIANGVIGTIGSFGGASDLIVKPVGSTFVQCCGFSSLAFYDYLGLMMGYIALFEGILTFLCAFFLYEIVRAIFKVQDCFK